MKTKLLALIILLCTFCCVSFGQDYYWLEDDVGKSTNVFDGYLISLLFGIFLFLFYLIGGFIFSFSYREDIKRLKNMTLKDKKEFAYMFIWIVMSASSFFQVSRHIKESPILSVLIFIILPLVLFFIFENKIKSVIDAFFRSKYKDYLLSLDCYKNNEEYKKGVEYSNMVISELELDEDFSNFNYYLLYGRRGFFKYKLGDYWGAVKDFTREISLISFHGDAFPNSNDNLFLFYELSVRSNIKLKEYEAALDSCNEAIKLNSTKIIFHSLKDEILALRSTSASVSKRWYL